MKRFARMIKNRALYLFIAVISMVLMFNLACEKLKVEKLKANQHFQRGNKYYVDEKYRKAADEYELAIKFNPDLKEIYFYAGTAYSQIYRPGDDAPQNVEYGKKAVEYLEKARQYEPENEKVIMALGYILKQMKKNDEAEKYFLMMLTKNKENPQAYYILADFYASNDQSDKAVEMYEKRIALDPENPEGYLFLARFYQERRAYDKCLDAHKRRIAIIEKNMTMDEKEKKKLLAEAYYTYGVVCWAKSYNTPQDVLGVKDRIALIEDGMAALDKAIEIDPLYPEPWAYKNLLLREKAKVEPLNEQKYIAMADEMAKKFTELRKQRTAAEAMMKELQKEQ